MMEAQSEWMVYPQLLERLNQLNPKQDPHVTLIISPNSNIFYSWKMTITDLVNSKETVEDAIAIFESHADIQRDKLVFQYVTKLQ